jgi:hypothetical protein
MAGSSKHELDFFLVKYMPDEIKGECVNIGVVLVGGGGDSGFADVRFTRDWRRVLCMDPGADVEWLQALERDVRMWLKGVSTREDILYKLRDLSSSLIQISEWKGCRGAEPAVELELLAKTYLEAPELHADKRAPSRRQRIVAAMQDAFEREGVWDLMRKQVVAETYTYKGDPLKIDCAYTRNNVIKMFHAVALSSNVDSAKVLAFSYPQLVQGVLQKEKAETLLTAVVEDHLDPSDEGILFALAMMKRSGIAVAEVGQMPLVAERVRWDLEM